MNEAFRKAPSRGRQFAELGGFSEDLHLYMVGHKVVFLRFNRQPELPLLSVGLR